MAWPSLVQIAAAPSLTPLPRPESGRAADLQPCWPPGELEAPPGIELRAVPQNPGGLPKPPPAVLASAAARHVRFDIPYDAEPGQPKAGPRPRPPLGKAQDALGDDEGRRGRIDCQDSHAAAGLAQSRRDLAAIRVGNMPNIARPALAPPPLPPRSRPAELAD